MMALDEQDNIQKMLLDGKISQDQAVLLKAALKASEQRNKILFCAVEEHKNKRKDKKLGFLIKGLLIGFFVLSAFLIAGKPGLSRDQVKAITYLEQSIVQTKNNQLIDAEKNIQKAIKVAPRFAIAHVFLAINSERLYQIAQNSQYNLKAQKSWAKAQKFIIRADQSQNKALSVFFFGVFILFVSGFLSIIFILMYQYLINREERVNEAWAQVVNICQRKVDLIPALSVVVEQYAQHEKQTLESIVQVRKKLVNLWDQVTGVAATVPVQAKEIELEQQALSVGLSQVLALSEKYLI